MESPYSKEKKFDLIVIGPLSLSKWENKFGMCNLSLSQHDELLTATVATSMS